MNGKKAGPAAAGGAGVSPPAGGLADDRIDIPELLARVEQDRELLEEALAIFKREFPLQLTALRAAGAAGDLPQLAARAHTLKGMLLSMSFGEAVLKAKQLEWTAQGNSASDVSLVADSLEEKVHAAEQALEAYLHEAAR